MCHSSWRRERAREAREDEVRDPFVREPTPDPERPMPVADAPQPEGEPRPEPEEEPVTV